MGLRFERARHRAALVLSDAAAQADMSEDKFIGIAEDSSQKTELVAETINAAARATTEQKLKALAAALARGITGDDKAAAQERLIVAAMADLEPIHLTVMAHPQSRPPTFSTENDWQKAMQNRPTGAYGWRPAEVAETLPDAAPVISAIFAALQRHGLIIDTAIGTFDYQPRYAITGFGLRCLTWLEYHNSVDAPAMGA